MHTVAQEKIRKQENTFYRNASYNDHNQVVDILCSSFQHDPHMLWLLEKCHNPDKFKIMMTYLFHKTMKVGNIYISKDECAVALWKSERKEKFSVEYILRNFQFLLDIGFSSVMRILKNERFTYNQYPKHKSFYHLYLIGVLPKCQGKGYASKLLNPILVQKAKENIPVYLETANIDNVKIYELKGFKLYNTWFKDGLELFYMKKY